MVVEENKCMLQWRHVRSLHAQHVVTCVATLRYYSSSIHFGMLLHIKQNPAVWLNGKVVIYSAKVVGSIPAPAVGLIFKGKFSRFIWVVRL